jgi:hypothetical protein
MKMVAVKGKKRGFNHEILKSEIRNSKSETRAHRLHGKIFNHGPAVTGASTAGGHG